MLLRGAVDSEDDSGSSSGAGIREVLPKRPFTSLEGGRMVIESRSSAKLLVQQQLHAAYQALLDCAEPMDGETSDTAAQAIVQLRRDGHEPDAVLLPRDVRLRATLSKHPEWQWTHDHHLATLSGVPVYASGPANAATLVVADLGASLRRVEHRRPGDPSPVRATVETINQERATQLWDEGERPTGNHGDRAAQEAALVRGYVETHIAIDVEWRNPHHTEPAARRIELPPVGHRRAPDE
jgi:hypothetical protein